MRPSELELSVVVPMRNETDSVAPLVKRIESALGPLSNWELICVDDGSDDDTWQRIRQAAVGRPWLRGIRLSRPFGQHPATFAGLAAARGSVIATMDADLEVAPEDVLKLVAEVSGGVDLAFGERSHKDRGVMRERIGRAATRLLARFAVGRPPAGISTFCAVRRATADAAREFTCARPVTPYHLMLGGPARVTSVSVREGRRETGRSKYPFLKLLALAADIAFGYTSIPEALLAGSAVAVPLGTILLWTFALAAGFAGLGGLYGAFALAGFVYAFAGFVWILLLVGEIALRSSRAQSGPLYVVAESF